MFDDEMQTCLENLPDTILLYPAVAKVKAKNKHPYPSTAL